MKITLSPSERSALKARAHGITPVVQIGEKLGLTAAVIREIERSLIAHELIKLRADIDDKTIRAEWLEKICEALSAAPVQHIGKVLVVWRENPDLVKARAKAALPPPKAKTKRLTKRQEEALAAGTARRRRVTAAK